MTFDASLPSNSTKIRNYPTVLTDNFGAIEQGNISLKHWQLNFIERDAIPSSPATTPTRADDTMILYSKQDGSGNTEMYVLDDNNPANSIQWTENGSLGSQNTALSASSLTFDGGTITNNQNNMCTAWAYVSSAGAIVAASGLTASKNATGDYTLTFSTAASNANYAVLGTVFTTDARARVVYVYSKSTASFSLRTQSIAASSGSYVDEAFMVAVFGGR